jgi:dephospho-CoA kinase
MLKVGLTGGIGSGKSTVSAMLAKLGARIIDADALAHEALAPGGPAYEPVVRAFGRRVLTSDGSVDRKALADIVFRDEDRRRLLEAIVHPVVLAEAERLTAEISSREPDAVVVLDAALLVESGAHARMDRLVVVWCSPGTQMSRLTEKCGLTPEEAALRIAAQMPLDEKRSYADHVVDNDGKIDDTLRQVEELYGLLKQCV